MKNSERQRQKITKARESHGWLLEQRDLVDTKVRAYRLEATRTMQSPVVEPWETLLGPTTFEVCKRECDQYHDKSQLRIRNQETGEIVRP